MCLSIFRFMDLSEEFEEFLKKSAILKSSGAELQIANRSHDRSYFNRSGTQRTVQNRCQPLPFNGSGFGSGSPLQCRSSMLRGPYLSAPIELYVLLSMDLKPRKSSFQPNLRLVNPNFLEEVMPVLVPEGQICQS